MSMCIIIYIDELIMHIYLGPFYVTGSSFPVHFRLSIKAKAIPEPGGTAR
uniref:Uncharacterized protein n=1 Tax=Anguilla anguilla TaxID=7936 RepID=A0A0E9Q190_ANGAN